MKKKLSRAKIYWQKAGNATCNKFEVSNVIDNNLFQSYLNQGWAAITGEFKSGRIGKEDTTGNMSDAFSKLSKSKQELALSILGSIRKYIVRSVFECQKNAVEYNEHFAAGSNNVTSDYDASITGPDANQIMWNMFTQFLVHYKGALPYAFDSNLYSSPLYIHTPKNSDNFDERKDINIREASEPTDEDNSLTGFPRVDYAERQFTLVPQTEDEIQEELNYAGIKLLGIKEKVTKKKYPILNNILQHSEKLKQYLENRKIEIEKDEDYINELAQFDFLKKQIRFHKKRELLPLAKRKDPMEYEIFRDYYLQYKAQEKLQDYVYKSQDLPLENFDGEDKKNIFFYQNQANYYASEAYYTSSAVNAVVVENQLETTIPVKREGDIILKTRVVTAIEQIGDMAHHISGEIVNKEDTGSVKKIILKYSKYIYRFYYVLGLIGENFKQYKEKAEEINDNIIPFRETYDIEEADKKNIWGIIDADNVENTKEGKDKYVNKLLNEMLEILEETLKKGGELGPANENITRTTSLPSLPSINKNDTSINQNDKDGGRKRKRTRRKKRKNKKKKTRKRR